MPEGSDPSRDAVADHRGRQQRWHRWQGRRAHVALRLAARSSLSESAELHSLPFDSSGFKTLSARVSICSVSCPSRLDHSTVLLHIGLSLSEHL
eukprot:15454401-Alexandrium_andersonii.AAC.1